MKARVAFIFAITLLLTSCALWPRYIPAEPRWVGLKPPMSNSSVAVLFKPVFPGKPLSETVVDNAVGAFWDPEEATQIGFTQNYAKSLIESGPQLAMLMAMPSSVRPGFAASGQGKGFNISSRIMVPIGRYVVDNTSKVLQEGTASYLVCLDSACMEQARETGKFDRYVTVQIQKLRVAEEMMNHLTLEVEAMTEVSDIRASLGTQSIRTVIKNRSIRSEGGFHSDFLRVMSKIADEASSDFARQILGAAKSIAGDVRHVHDPASDLVGTWYWTMPSGKCTETHTYRQDGSRSVISGAEKSDSTFVIEQIPNSRFRKLTITTTKDYRGKDCGDTDEDDTGRTSSVYYVIEPDGSKVLFCYQPELGKCYGPFSRASAS